jgi:hypothetical protein
MWGESVASSWYSIARKLSTFLWDNESDHSYGDSPELEGWDELTSADLYTSQVVYPNGNSWIKDGEEPKHVVAIDLDIPAVLIPTSTPGHSHLLIDKELTWEEYSTLLNALAAAGIIEEGYNEISQKRKRTDLRTPWTVKPNQLMTNTEEHRQFQRSIKFYEKRDEKLWDRSTLDNSSST